VLAGLALAVGAVVLVWSLDRSVTATSDALSRSRVSDLAQLLRDGDLPAVLADAGGDGVAQVFDADGRVLAASPNVRGARPIVAAVRHGGKPRVRTVFGAPDDAETEDYRVWAQRVRGPDGPVTVVVGTSLESVSEATHALRRSLWLGTPVAVVVLGLLVWLVLGRALHPVERIRAEVESITASRLDRRVPVPAARDELGRLALTMNRMLDRLEEAQLRQQRLVADASHELQTPVAAIRSQVEVALAHPDGTDWTALARGVLEDADRTERLVRDLLFLARHDETDAAGTPAAPLDLDDIVLEEVERVRARTTVGIDTGRVSAAPVRGRADDLRRLVGNLLDNGVRHAASRVEVSLSCVDDRVVLVVADDGPGVPVAERERVFERFHRSDSSRARGPLGSGGTGLGLSISRAVAEQHGGTLRLAREGPGARFVATFPALQGGFSAGRAEWEHDPSQGSPDKHPSTRT
jgi:signal transduction histidine kinase